MRAMVYRGPYRVRVEEKDIPAIEHPNDAIVRVTRAAICGSDLHLYHGMMPDTRVGMTFGHEFIGVVHEVGLVGAERAAGRPGDGAVQRVLRDLLLLRPRALLQLPQREPERHRRRRHLRLLPHLRRVRRRAGGVRPGAVRRRRSRDDPGLDGRRRRRPAHRRAADRVLRRPARRHRRGRRGRGVRRRSGGPVRRQVGVAHGRRPRDRRRPPRLPAPEGAGVRPRRDDQLHRARRRGPCTSST